MCPAATNEASTAPVEQLVQQAKEANDRLFQAMAEQVAMQKEIGRLEKEIAVLKERIDARDQTISDREQMLADLRDFYEIQEEDVGSEELSALTARSKESINK